MTIRKPKRKNNVDRPYCSGTMTLAAMRSFLINMIRKKSMYWKPIGEARRNSRDGAIINEKTGRSNIAAKCSQCSKRVLEKEIKIDHIKPVVPLSPPAEGANTFLGYDWTEVMRNAFAENGGYQALCKECHQVLTNWERAERKRLKNDTN